MMRDVMYELPSQENVAEVTINRAAVDGTSPPLIRYNEDQEAA
jgi:ATP-dependent Clp protease ATP-binding subunit ClpX